MILWWYNGVLKKTSLGNPPVSAQLGALGGLLVKVGLKLHLILAIPSRIRMKQTAASNAVFSELFLGDWITGQRTIGTNKKALLVRVFWF